MSRSPVVKALYIAAGTVSLGLGVAGVFLPLLPATPFLLLASACYLRGSQRLHDMLMNHRHLGPYVRYFRERRGIPRRAKVYTVALLWGSIFASAYALDSTPLRLLLAAVAVTATFFILRMKTLEAAPRDRPDEGA
jgi:uncharacterized membrane protein YbaN (DUF454 family)